MNKKITELNEATEINEADLLTIVQNNENKKIKATMLIEHKYTVKVTAQISANTEYTLPCYYQVGTDTLDVFCMGEKLIKDTSDCER